MSNVSVAGRRFWKRASHDFLRPHELKRIKTNRLPFFKRNDFVLSEDEYKDFEQWRYFPGDRVMITTGEKKGTVTKVVSYINSSNSLILEDGPTYRTILPKQFWQPGTTSYVNEIPEGVKPQDLKLVAKVHDEATGKDKDVIVHKFEFLGKHFNKEWQTWLPTRVVKDKGEVLYLPWPAPESPLERTGASGEDANSERSYYVDSVVHNQIPKDALKDIRNPYSKYKRGTFEQRHLNKFTAPDMPLSETKKAYLSELEAKKALGHKKLTPEVKDFIGGRVKKFVESQKKDLNIQ
ncbi:mitochondrial 54S ribosomal protein YmL40 [Saccharomycopsis crataegensis]|uniref:Mitochondrial 54S ribosomal protein YmL40 n=1 Tax=Saccharomycopsis crataegensis TaxID=43959 RepID=A0AAV5QJA8_9ASCO|nr:mitochondrial 54S ribosomal protein YmL40 [Saccharomycopsis crataegensis]